MKSIFIVQRNVHYEYGEVISAHDTRQHAREAAALYPGATEDPNDPDSWDLRYGTEDLEIIEIPLQCGPPKATS